MTCLDESDEAVLRENREVLEQYAAKDKELSDVAAALLEYYDSSINDSMSTSESSIMA